MNKKQSLGLVLMLGGITMMVLSKEVMYTVYGFGLFVFGGYLVLSGAKDE